MKHLCNFWLFGIVLIPMLTGNITADDGLPVDKVSPVSGQVKACGGTTVGSRWCNQGNGTIKDMTTGLVWSQRADCWGRLRWYEILPLPFKRLRHGACGLADDSEWGDWRPPTRRELAALTSGPANAEISIAVRLARTRAVSSAMPSAAGSQIRHGPRHRR